MSLLILCISVVSVVTSTFSFFIIIDLSPICFFLDESGYQFFNESTLVSLISFMVFFISVSFISHQIFIIPFLLLTLGFALGLGKIIYLRFFLVS